MLRRGARSGSDAGSDGGVGDRAGRTPREPDRGAAGETISLVSGLRQELHHHRSALEASQALVRQTELALGQTHSELRLASAALMTAQEMERKRIASELHDSIGQALNALSFGIGVVVDMCRDGEAKNAIEMLDHLNQQVKATVEEVRRIAMDLRPATLDDLGIIGTLSWFFREFRAVQPRLVLRTQIAVDEKDVPERLRTPIYRIVQEALNNIVKHAQASEIYVALARNASGLTLEVQDNGRGFTGAANTLRSGMGLTGMRDRVEFSGGSFSLRSIPGTGTCVLAAWPLIAAGEGA